MIPQLTQVSNAQAHAVTVNDDFQAVTAGALLGSNNTLTVGLTFAYYGGYILVDGVQTLVAAGTLTLTASVTNYIEMTRAGVVSSNSSGFTAGRIPLYTAVTNTVGITALTDFRVLAAMQPTGRLVKAMPSDANYTLTADEARNQIIEISGGTSLGGTRNIVMPLLVAQYTVLNASTGAQSLQFIGGSGTGITVANGKRAIIYCDGTNFVRVTSDT